MYNINAFILLVHIRGCSEIMSLNFFTSPAPPPPYDVTFLPLPPKNTVCPKKGGFRMFNFVQFYEHFQNIYHIKK